MRYSKSFFVNIGACLCLVAMMLLFGCAPTLFLTKPATPKTIERYDTYIKKNAPGEDAFVAVQRIAEPYIQEHQWIKAADVFRQYRPFFNTIDDRFQKIIDLLEADEEGLQVSNIGPNINTEADEYIPTPTADGLRLYFTGRNRDDCIGGEDNFVSELHNGEWQRAENLVNRINTRSNEAITSISADGNRILLFGNFDESLGRGDNFYADRTKKDWGGIEHFPNPVNTKYFDCDGYVTSDGKAFLFTSDRPGGIGDFHQKDKYFHGDIWGNTDIYVCLKKSTDWSELINLGPTINTPYCERTPFLHPDGKTLYFSSDGHYGLGRMDVFKTVRLSDTSWTEWSEPVNLGKEINDSKHDWGYKVATKGDVAYFAAQDKSVGYAGWDIYSITLPQEARPEFVATVRGIVTDGKRNPLEAEINWEDLSKNENVGQLRSNPQDGSYFIALPLGKMYGYYAEKQGYYPVSKNIDLQHKINSIDITENITMMSIEEMKEKEITVRINNIFFDYDKYDLKPESYPELNRLARILKENSDVKVEIEGHTDSEGSDEYNLTLSRNRSQSVVDYLVLVGCNPPNLIARGYGESMPIATNDTEEGRAINRRVEFRFLKE